MFVKLPRECTGEEIVKAFKAASEFQETPSKKWRPDEFIAEFQYEHGSVQKTARRVGVRFVPFQLGKSWVIFGKNIWGKQPNNFITLLPVILSEKYSEVQIVVQCINPYGAVVTQGVTSACLDRLSAAFQKILSAFFESLQASAPKTENLP